MTIGDRWAVCVECRNRVVPRRDTCGMDCRVGNQVEERREGNRVEGMWDTEPEAQLTVFQQIAAKR